MKKFNYLSVLFIALMATIFVGCKDEKDDPAVDSEEQILFNSNEIGNGDQEFEIKGKHTLKKGTYILKGWVYVTNGAQLTIEPGTIIKGDLETKASLIIEPGGKIYAEGTAELPIVFTSNQAKGSRKPGDWGGIIVCGRAKNNKGAMLIEGGPRTLHGGNNDEDNSGILRYVRIEFAGYPLKTDQEINGLTLGSVGSGTQIDHIQVSYTNDDSFEFFGGSVNAKYLVAYHGWDDDFDTDNGYSGKLQFLLGIRNPKIADTSLSNGFESDNNSEGSTSSPVTHCVFSNVTLVGPLGQDANFANNAEYINAGVYNPNNGSKTGLYQAAMHIRRNTNLSCFNSVAIGFPVGLILDNEKGTVQTAATEGNLVLNNIFFGGMTILGADANKKWLDQLSTNGKDLDPTQESFSSTYFKTSGRNNQNYESIVDLKLKQPNSLLANTNYGPQASSPLLGAASFSHSLLTGFDVVTYVGAFASDSDNDNWTKGWCNFDPQNTDY